jgi:hypothetical protein
MWANDVFTSEFAAFHDLLRNLNSVFFPNFRDLSPGFVINRDTILQRLARSLASGSPGIRIS